TVRFSVHVSRGARDRHSFPTRRSSDLDEQRQQRSEREDDQSDGADAVELLPHSITAELTVFVPIATWTTSRRRGPPRYELFLHAHGASPTPPVAGCDSRGAR